MLSTELRLALAPARTYRHLVVERATAGPLAVLRPLGFSLVATGVAVAIIATGRVSLGLAITVAASWSFTLVLQLVAGAVLILSAPRLVTLPRAFELLVRGHAPWSLWMLAVSAYAVVGNPHVSADTALLTGVAPSVWTMGILSAYGRAVLVTSPWGAWCRAVLHQAAVWAFAIGYVAWAAGGLTDIVANVGQ